MARSRNPNLAGWWRRLSVRHLWVLVPVLGIGFMVGHRVTDNSFLWHVRAGALQLESGEVIRSDPFSYTFQGEPWRTQSWLVELAYGWLEGLTGGVTWASVMVVVAATATVALTGVAVYRSVRSPLVTAVALVAVVWILRPYLVPRPAGLALLFLPLILLQVSPGGRARWMAVPTIWIWAAIHGSFVVGLGLIALEAIRQRSRRLGAVAVAAAVVASMTAHGPGLWSVLGRFLASRDSLAIIAEWAPPDFTEPALGGYLLIIAGTLVAATRGRLVLPELIVVVPFLLFGLTSRRNVYVATIVLVPFAARALVSSRRGEAVRAQGADGRGAAFNWALAGTALAALILVTTMGAAGASLRGFPIEAASLLDGKKVFHNDYVAGYLLYAHWPGTEVFVDDRAELYGDFYLEFADVLRGREDWEGMFARYDVEGALLVGGSRLDRDLVGEGWREGYRDDRYVVLWRP